MTLTPNVLEKCGANQRNQPTDTHTNANGLPVNLLLPPQANDLEPFFLLAPHRMQANEPPIITASAVLMAASLTIIAVCVLRKIVRNRLNARKCVMISYRHLDAEFANKLEAELASAGFKIWIDTQIKPASDWRDNIAAAIKGCVA